MRRPVRTDPPARPRRVDAAWRDLPSREPRILGDAARVEGAAAVAEPEVEPAVGPEGELAAVVVLLGLVDVEQPAAGRGSIAPSARAELGDAGVAARSVQCR